MFRAWLAALLGGCVAACSPLSLYNRLAPRDAGAHKVAQDIAFGADPRQRLDVYRPKGAIKAPVVIFVYGGSWASGRRQDYGFMANVFAARGYVTVVPDYRLVPKVRFPAFIDDGAAAVAWTTKHAASYGADPQQIFLVGHSAGAYNVAMLALDASYLKNAGVDSGRIKGVIGLSGPYDFYPFDVPASIDAFGQTAEPLTTQPISFVRADAPPMLLLHGAADKTVGPHNSKSLDAKLHGAGAAVTTKIYPKLSHSGLLLTLTPLRRKRAPVLKDVEAFIAAHSSN
jgi:acetyl esterase/lipase